jgi:uncharacterized protein YpmS
MMSWRFTAVLAILAIVAAVVIYTFIASWLEETRKNKKQPPGSS